MRYTKKQLEKGKIGAWIIFDQAIPARIRSFLPWLARIFYRILVNACFLYNEKAIGSLLHQDVRA